MFIVRLVCATRWLLLLLLIQQPARCGGRNGRRRATQRSPAHRRQIWLTSQKKMRQTGELPNPPAAWRRSFLSETACVWMPTRTQRIPTVCKMSVCNQQSQETLGAVHQNLHGRRMRGAEFSCEGYTYQTGVALLCRLPGSSSSRITWFNTYLQILYKVAITTP